MVPMLDKTIKTYGFVNAMDQILNTCTLSIFYFQQAFSLVLDSSTGRKNEFASNLPCANMLQIWNLQSFATSAKVAIAEFARFCANSAIATFALVAKLCKFHICNIFAQGKFDANSFFRPV